MTDENIIVSWNDKSNNKCLGAKRWKRLTILKKKAKTQEYI